MQDNEIIFIINYVNYRSTATNYALALTVINSPAGIASGGADSI